MKNIIALSILASSLFNGCILESKKAKVVDSEVEGLEYQCGGLVNYTPKNGNLTCAHIPIAFKIGELRLGVIYKIPNDGIILPQDIVGVSRANLKDKEVEKLSIIFQSLDSDKNPENGITISKKISEQLTVPMKIEDYTIDEIKELIDTQVDEEIEFKESDSAIMHLNRSMRRFNIVK